MSLSRIWTFLKTEPVLVTNAVQAALGVVVAFGIGLTADQTGAILGACGAVLTVIAAVSVRPLQVSAFTGLVTAAAALALSFGVHLPAGGVASANLLVAAVLAVATRAQVTPVAKLPKPAPVPPAADPAPQEPGRV